MIITQSDKKNTLSLIGEFLAYHNLLKYLCNRYFNGIKNAPEEFQERLLKYKIARDRLAHELWEILNSNIVALNNGYPDWEYSHEELKELKEDLFNCKNEILKIKPIWTTDY